MLAEKSKLIKNKAIKYIEHSNEINQTFKVLFTFKNFTTNKNQEVGDLMNFLNAIEGRIDQLIDEKEVQFLLKNYKK